MFVFNDNDLFLKTTETTGTTGRTGATAGCHEVTYNRDNKITVVNLVLLVNYACLYFVNYAYIFNDNSSTSLKWQPAFRLVKVVFVVVNRQHSARSKQTVVIVVSVVVKKNSMSQTCES